MPDFLIDDPADADVSLVLAHGAGAGMESAFMSYFAGGLGARGVRVVRFEFPYMRRRRAEGRKLPPDRMAVLHQEFAGVVEHVRRESDPAFLMIGGKSMGGRVASMVADDLNVGGVICLGYPFHPAGRPPKLRTAHLYELRTPALIVQGTRDPLGSREEVERLELPSSIEISWSEDGNHDLAPRRASGRTTDDNLRTALSEVCDFIRRKAALAGTRASEAGTPRSST